MLNDILQGIGGFTLLVLAFNYYVKWQAYKQAVESIEAETRHLRARKGTHPEEAEAIDRKLRELIVSYPPRPRIL